MKLTHSLTGADRSFHLAYIQISMPEPKKQRLSEIAAEEGVDQLTTLCRRVLYLYMRDPAKFHLLLFENKRRDGQSA